MDKFKLRTEEETAKEILNITADGKILVNGIETEDKIKIGDALLTFAREYAKDLKEVKAKEMQKIVLEVKKEECEEILNLVSGTLEGLVSCDEIGVQIAINNFTPLKVLYEKKVNDLKENICKLEEKCK